jgi:hypothetical protein
MRVVTSAQSLKLLGLNTAPVIGLADSGSAVNSTSCVKRSALTDARRPIGERRKFRMLHQELVERLWPKA